MSFDVLQLAGFAAPWTAANPGFATTHLAIRPSRGFWRDTMGFDDRMLCGRSMRCGDPSGCCDPTGWGDPAASWDVATPGVAAVPWAAAMPWVAATPRAAATPCAAAILLAAATPWAWTTREHATTPCGQAATAWAAVTPRPCHAHRRPQALRPSHVLRPHHGLRDRQGPHATRPSHQEPARPQPPLEAMRLRGGVPVGPAVATVAAAPPCGLRELLACARSPVLLWSRRAAPHRPTSSSHSFSSHLVASDIWELLSGDPAVVVTHDRFCASRRPWRAQAAQLTSRPWRHRGRHLRAAIPFFALTCIALMAAVGRRPA